MEYGIFCHVGNVDDLAADLRAAETDGLHSYWLSQGFGHDALTAIAVAGRGLLRLRIGTAVIPVQPRHPMVLAQQALTTSGLVDGRLVLGLGPSHPQVVGPCWGLSYERPARYVREYVESLSAALTQRVRFRGETITARGDLTVPGDPPVPPVMLAALGPRMLEVAGALTDGTITWMVGPRTLREHVVPALQSAADRAGRRMPEVVVTAPVCVTDDPVRATSEFAPALRWYDDLPSYRTALTREGLDSAVQLAVAGPADHVREQVAAYAGSGATTFAAQPFGNDDEQAATRDLLARMARVP